MNVKNQVESVAKTEKGIEYTLKLLTADVGRANKCMMDNAIEKALVEFDKQIDSNFKVVKGLIAA
jgi:hypothetical protein